MELEESEREFKPVRDARPLLPEPLPVKLVAVADVRLPTQAGLETDLDAFYVGVFVFRRIPEEIAYQAENFAVRFDVVEVLPERQDYRPLGLEVPSLRLAEAALIEREWAYTRQKGLIPGTEALVLRDPAGNWVEAYEARAL